MYTKVCKPDLTYCFDRMVMSFKQEEAQGIKGVIKFIINGGNEQELWYLSITPSGCEASCEVMENDTTITIDKDLFIDGFMGKQDMTQAFIIRRFHIQGNLELAMSMNFLFEQPKPYDAWFYTLEQSHIPERSIGKKIIYRFSILDTTLYDDGIQINEPITRYRNIIIDNGTCMVTPHDNIPFDVEFLLTEESLMKMAEGDKSYYDLFLLNEINFLGANGNIFDFPSYFIANIFPNRDVTEITVDRVFAQMPKMIDEIPSKLRDKVICINVTGSEGGIYYIQILDEFIKVIPKNEVERINAKITMASKVFYGFCFNEIDYHSALDESLIQFQGDVNIGMAFDSVVKYRLTRKEEVACD